MAATVFQVFRIMFGLILAGFILYFFVSYAGVYAETQESVIRAGVIDNLAETIREVYRTGVSVPFDKILLSGLEYEISFDADYNPPVHFPGILESTVMGTETLLVPTLVLPGEFQDAYIYVYRETVDLGWWSFYFVEALSDISIIFVTIEDGSDVQGLVGDIADAFPSTEQTSAPKVTFGFCDGSSLYLNDLCGGQRCEKYGFQDVISSAASTSSKCTLTLPSNYRLVTIADSCSPTYVSSGVCFRLPDSDGVGYAYIPGSSESYVYKNSLDMLALIIGGDEQTLYGITGDNYYVYVNGMFTEFINTASEMLGERAGMLEAAPGTDPDCVPGYGEFGDRMDEISNLLASDPGYYEDYGSVTGLLALFEEAGSIYSGLISMGCEVW